MLSSPWFRTFAFQEVRGIRFNCDVLLPTFYLVWQTDSSSVAEIFNHLDCWTSCFKFYVICAIIWDLDFGFSHICIQLYLFAFVFHFNCILLCDVSSYVITVLCFPCDTTLYGRRCGISCSGYCKNQINLGAVLCVVSDVAGRSEEQRSQPGKQL